MMDDVPVCKLLIPDKEIKAVFKKEMIDSLPRNIAKPVIRNFQLALKSNDADELENTLRQYLLQCASSFDTAQENFYHGMMMGLLAIMSDEYFISSNRESGEGRFDIQLRPMSKSNPGILMEFKAVEDENLLSKSADEAIEQMKEKQYVAELAANGVARIQLYGIAFCKKKVTVKTYRNQEN